MNLTLGYLKDVLAVNIFILCFIILYNTQNLNTLRPIIFAGLFLAFITDSIFSIYPELHNMHFETFIHKFIK
jgi:hypothetical protein